MYTFYQDFGVIISFLVMTLLISSLGPKITRGFLILTLVSMAILNSSKFNDILSKSFKKGGS